MTKIRKLDKGEQEFDRNKLESSIRNAGADEATAREISQKISPREGMTTEDIRRQVWSELNSTDPNMARNYQNARRPVVRRAHQALPGTLFASSTMLGNLRLKPGECINLSCGDRTLSLTAQMEESSGQLARNEILLSEKDMSKLGLSEGRRVTVMREL